MFNTEYSKCVEIYQRLAKFRRNEQHAFYQSANNMLVRSSLISSRYINKIQNAMIKHKRMLSVENWIAADG